MLALTASIEAGSGILSVGGIRFGMVSVERRRPRFLPVEGTRFGVSGLEFVVSGLGFSGLGFEVSGLGFRGWV